MPEHTIAPRTYVQVCVALVLLTFLTVGVSFLHMEGVWHIVLGLIIAICKASLVVLFFMHALFSSRVTWMVIAVSAFWVGLLFVLTSSDYLTRLMIPHMPGH
jgi:cytochrome c oxidase subunit 4